MSKKKIITQASSMLSHIKNPSSAQIEYAIDAALDYSVRARDWHFRATDKMMNDLRQEIEAAVKVKE